MSEFVNRIIKEYSPVVFLSKKENYFPCSIEYYLKYSKAHIEGKVYEEGTFNKDNIPLDASITFDINEEKWEGEKGDSLEEIPYYVRFLEKEDTYELIYHFLYAYNGGYQVCHLPCEKCKEGSHQADIEHITIVIDKETYENYLEASESKHQAIKQVYFAAHGSKQGLWVNRSDLYYYDGKIAVFSSFNSHASYPEPGIYWRCLGAINDYTEEGIKWKSKNVILVSDDDNWCIFQGRMGYPAEVSPMAEKDWWNGESGKSIGFWKRFCCLCLS
jgi:hypothetical protein